MRVVNTAMTRDLHGPSYDSASNPPAARPGVPGAHGPLHLSVVLYMDDWYLTLGATVLPWRNNSCRRRSSTSNVNGDRCCCGRRRPPGLQDAFNPLAGAHCSGATGHGHSHRPSQPGPAGATLLVHRLRRHVEPGAPHRPLLWPHLQGRGSHRGRRRRLPWSPGCSGHATPGRRCLHHSLRLFYRRGQGQAGRLYVPGGGGGGPASCRSGTTPR